MTRRHEASAGVFLGIPSLPKGHGIGDIGTQARQFAGFLAEAGQRWWQMCPVGPTGFGNSPYQNLSTFAGNPLLISLEDLHQEGLLNTQDLKPAPNLDPERVDYPAVQTFKIARLRKAYLQFETGSHRKLKREMASFERKNAHWLPHYAAYAAIKDFHNGRPWWEWHPDIRSRKPAAFNNILVQLKTQIGFQNFAQFLFFRQWQKLKMAANRKGIGLIGDLPFYASLDSSCAWMNTSFFHIPENGRPKEVAGVPVDPSHPVGQKWGHPLYNWEAHKKTGYIWWTRRLEHALSLFDLIRLDHFIGFHRSWAVPVKNGDALVGRWRKGPGAPFFQKILKTIPRGRIVVENLGMVTKEVEDIRRRFGFPGMRVLQFFFHAVNGSKPHPLLGLESNTLIYTATHDNETTRGWLKSMRKHDKKRVLNYFNSSGPQIHWDMIRLALNSSARIALYPAQDLLGLDNRARLNAPGTPGGNWEWRLPEKALKPGIQKRLRTLARKSERV